MEWRTPAPKRQPVGFIAPCIPVRSFTPPSGDRWLHEIKHDGYRLIVCRRGGRVRLFTRRGYDWIDRYPLIRVAAEALPVDATIDGEAVVVDDAGLASFELMHSREHDQRAILKGGFQLPVGSGGCQQIARMDRQRFVKSAISRPEACSTYNSQIAQPHVLKSPRRRPDIARRLGLEQDECKVIERHRILVYTPPVEMAGSVDGRGFALVVSGFFARQTRARMTKIGRKNENRFVWRCTYGNA